MSEMSSVSPTESSTHRESRFDSIDCRVLLSRCMGNLQFAQAVLDEFLASSRQKATEIARLAAHQRWADLTDLAHSLKGAAAIVGAERVRQRAWCVEQAGKAGDLAKLGHLVEELYEEVQRCLQDLPEIRRQLNASRPATSQPTCADSTD
ncbi:MAG: hypothetical protein KatS3mg109_1364 [Pirellulaceae bacterium]|nr:MAG: hypothetical protein KatS3mg109_1364 [Pirellulaceae bacterium]